MMKLFNTINAKVSTAESSPSHNYAGDQGGGEICKPLCHLLLAKRHLDPRFLGTIVHPLTQDEGRLLKKKVEKRLLNDPDVVGEQFFHCPFSFRGRVWAQNNALWKESGAEENPPQFRWHRAWVVNTYAYHPSLNIDRPDCSGRCFKVGPPSNLKLTASSFPGVLFDRLRWTSSWAVYVVNVLSKWRMGWLYSKTCRLTCRKNKLFSMMSWNSCQWSWSITNNINWSWLAQQGPRQTRLSTTTWTATTIISRNGDCE